MIRLLRRDRAPKESGPFFFVHLQKTAGTALWRRLQQQFGPASFYPGPGDGSLPDCVLVVENLVERWRVRGNEIRIVTGHFPLCTTELLGGQFITLTILRDPVERMLSALRHHREETPADTEKPLEEIYDDPVRYDLLLHNHMVKMLSLTVEEMTDGALTPVSFTPERLTRAKERLSTIDAVGLQEHFEPFCDELTRRFGWELGHPRFANRTKPVAVADSFRTRIADDNADDIELYEFAREHYGPRRMSAAAPKFVAAILADARITAAHRGERFVFRSTVDALTQAFRLALVTDAFFALCLYRLKVQCQARRIPVLPQVLQRLAMTSVQVSIGDPVVVEPGVYLIHGQVVIDGFTEIGSGTSIGPFVTIGLVAGNYNGPTVGRRVAIGTGAKILGPVRIGNDARIGANAVVLRDVPEGATAVGVPARIVAGARSD